MLLRGYLVVVICGVFIASGAVSGKEEKKAVGNQVSFRPVNPLPDGVTSITWKQIKSGVTIKAIEWEDGETTSPNPRFNGFTTLDTETGQITITNLTVAHTGVYTIDISGKEQEQRFNLTVMKPVPKPEITIEKTDNNPGVVYLRCKYVEKIIWKNSTGETLKGSAEPPKGESVTVTKTSNPEIFYTCTLQNAVSEETSERVYERDLFKDESSGGSGWIAFVVIIIPIVVIIIFAILYKRNANLRGYVDDKCTCIKGTNKETKKTEPGSPSETTARTNNEEATPLSGTNKETKKTEPGIPSETTARTNNEEATPLSGTDKETTESEKGSPPGTTEETEVGDVTTVYP